MNGTQEAIVWIVGIVVGGLTISEFAGALRARWTKNTEIEEDENL
ncbi:MAG TPA: hypothetical protein VN039_12665 [Nitrospira sp.]|nr:hypothetical protein [Nitrospira sp.]